MPGEQGMIHGDHKHSYPQTYGSAPHQVDPWQRKGWNSNHHQPGFQALRSLALLFLGLSQGIPLLSLFWEKEAFWSPLEKSLCLVLNGPRGCSSCIASSSKSRRQRLLRACTHTHVHSPENGRGIDPRGKSLLF